MKSLCSTLSVLWLLMCIYTFHKELNKLLINGSLRDILPRIKGLLGKKKKGGGEDVRSHPPGRASKSLGSSMAPWQGRNEEQMKRGKVMKIRGM